MKFITSRAWVAAVVGALAILAAAQANEIQPRTLARYALQRGAEQAGELRSDLPAHVTAPGQVSAGQTKTPVGQRAGAQAVSDPAIPGQVLDRRKMRGVMGPADSSDSHMASEARPNSSDNASQDPASAEARGNGHAATGADGDQSARSTQTYAR